MSIPCATKIQTSYENIDAECPSCGRMCVFNRATDLKDFGIISFRTVKCDGCRKPFNINGDSVNAAHEKLIFDCHELLDLKHYMHCILTLAQAHEVFFSLFLRVELLYKPFAEDPDMDLDQFNRLAEMLERKVGDHPFKRMQALFLKQLVAGIAPKSLVEAEAAIAALEKHPKVPTNEELEALPNEQLVALLKAVKGTTINKLRNQVVHKWAYRPSREEAETALQESRSVLFPLTQRLRLRDDINWYISRRNRDDSRRGTAAEPRTAGAS